MKVNKSIIFVLIPSYLLMIAGCTEEVTKYHTIEEPYYEAVEVPRIETKTVPKYKNIPPVFPLPKGRPMLLAILPFTASSSEGNWGIEVAEEIEYAMLKHPNAESVYRLLNRTQLQSVFTEQELAGLNRQTIIRSRQLLNVEGLITGHVRERTSNHVSFILKAINTRDASVLFTQRFEGNYADAVQSVVGVFYDNRLLEGYETISDTTYSYETVTHYRTKSVPYTVKEDITGYVVAAILLGGALIFLIAWAASQSEKGGD